jgi:hypothetical protein
MGLQRWAAACAVLLLRVVAGARAAEGDSTLVDLTIDQYKVTGGPISSAMRSVVTHHDLVGGRGMNRGWADFNVRFHRKLSLVRSCGW